MCVKLFITSQCPNKSGIKIERREAHQLQSHNSAQSCSNLMWSRTEASSAVVRAAEPSWELCVWACVSPCENRHWEKVKLLFGWRCMRYLSPYPLSPVLTPCPTSQPSPHSHSPPTLHSHLLWHERGTDAKSSHTTNSVLKKNPMNKHIFRGISMEFRHTFKMQSTSIFSLGAQKWQVCTSVGNHELPSREWMV